MSEDKIFFISWKGDETGPFSATEIREMLATGKIGYLHFVRTKNSERIPIKDANLDELAKISPVDTPNIVRKNESFMALLYAVAGLAFLSPWVFIVSVALSAFAFSIGDKRNARFSLILSSLICLAGIVFFGSVYPTIAK